MQKTFGIISLGCPRNLVDSEHIISEFRRRGYLFRENVSDAHTVIINTCSFIEDAKKESIDIILKAIDAKKVGAIKKVIVAGCLSQRYARELKDELKEIDEFRGVMDFKKPFRSDFRGRLTPRHYAYLKISEGCGNKCTYCIIPYLKGPYVSRRMGTLIEETRHLLRENVKEVILVGQDTALYGIDLYGKKRLDGLLEKIDRISDKNWVRLLYCHPLNLDKEVIKLIRNSRHICRYIDLPIEHISNKILKRMGRRTTAGDIVWLIRHIRNQIKGVAIRTSIIVGFPGEREKDFKELVSFIRETRFERLGLFKYSREEGTPAFDYDAQVPEKERERRFNEVMQLQQDISREINEKFKGRILKVLIDEKREDCYIGRSEYDAPEVDGLVYVKGENLSVGNFYDVRITDMYEYDLVGEVV